MLNSILDKFVNNYNISPNSQENQKRDLAFELLSCVVAFDKSPYFAKDNCWNSVFNENRYEANRNDGKIDGFSIDIINNEIVVGLIQSKNTSNISTREIRDFFLSVQMYIINLNNLLEPEYSGLEKLRTQLIDVKLRNPEKIVKYDLVISCICVSNRLKESIENSFKTIFQDNEHVKLRFLYEQEMITKISRIKKDIVDEVFEDNNISLKFEKQTSCVESSYTKIVVGVINAKEVIQLINSEFKVNFELSRLFSGNVRGFLDETPINLEIKNTIENDNLYFLSKNNGAVLVCDSFTLQADNVTIILKNPMIINGQQTFSSIYKYAKKRTQQENVKVVLKIIEINGDQKDKMILEIAKASNSSNEITDLDLLSNRPFIKKLKTYFGEKGVYLKIKKGEILNDVFFEDEVKIVFSDLIKTWVSIFLERPSDAKATKKNIHIFSDAYKSPSSVKSRILLSDENFNRISSTFYDASLTMKIDYKNIMKRYFETNTYYEHAQFFILYLLKKEFPNNYLNPTENELENIKIIVENLISNEKNTKGADYTHNNYFKSFKPQADYLENKKEDVLSVEESLEKLFSE